MAKELLPDALWARIAPLLPPEPPKPKGGRPRVSGRAALTGDPVRAEDGHPLGVLACRDGVWERDDVLAEAARLVPSGRRAKAAPGASRRAGPGRSHRLGPGHAGLRRGAGSGGGQETGKNPTDRGKQGTKRHLVVDAHGIPLAVLVSAANVHDSKMMLATVDAIKPIRAKTRGSPVADRTSSMPTRVTTTVTSVWPCASAASSPASPAVVSSPRTAWDATAGWSNGRSPGSTASGA
jgi:transposase